MFFENVSNRLIQVYANNIVLPSKLRLCLYKINMNYSPSPFFFAIYSSIKTICLLFCFPKKIMYIWNIASAIKKMIVNKLRDCIFENRWIRFFKEKCYYSMKHQKTKLQSFATKLIKKWNFIILIWREKDTKLVKRSEIATFQPNAIENPNIVDMKSVIIKHLQTPRLQ